jgi:hypothetical protein
MGKDNEHGHFSCWDGKNFLFWGRVSKRKVKKGMKVILHPFTGL